MGVCLDEGNPLSPSKALYRVMVPLGTLLATHASPLPCERHTERSSTIHDAFQSMSKRV